MIKHFIQEQRSKVVILAPGSSLSSKQVNMIKESKLYTIAIGDAGRIMHDTADVLYHCDASCGNIMKVVQILMVI